MSLFWSQTRGLLIRGYHYQRRQTCSNICNFIVPSLYLILLSVLQRVLQNSGDDVILPEERTPLGGYVARPFKADQCLDQVRAVGDAGVVAQQCLADPFVNKFTVPFYGPEGSDQLLGARDTAGNTGSGVLGALSLQPFIYPPSLPGGDFAEKQTFYDGVFLNEYGNNSVSDPTYQIFAGASAAGQIDANYETKTKRLPNKAAFLEDIFNSWFKGGSFNPYHAAYGVNSISGDLGENTSPFAADVTVYYNESESYGNCTEVCQAFSGVQKLDSALFAALKPGASAMAYLRRFPIATRDSDFDFISLVISVVLALCLHFHIPTMTAIFVYERQSRMRELMATSGLKPPLYWLGTYIYMIIIYSITVIVLVIVGFAFNIPFFRLNSVVSYGILFFLWGHLVVAHAVFLSPFFKSPETAVVLVWLLVVLLTFVGGPYLGTLSSTDASETVWFFVMLCPSFAMQRSVYWAGAFNTGGQGITTGSQTYSQDIELGMCSGRGPFCRSYVFLIVEWFILMALGLYFDQVLPSSTGVRKHPLFFLGMKRGRSKKNEGGVINMDDGPDAEALPDVAAQRGEVDQLLADGVSTARGIVLDDVHKVYYTAKPPHHAVRGLSFTAREGEVTGLLGSNGAGKTSLTRMLVGSIDPSAGDAYVNGRSIRTDLPEIHRNMGICFQQDIQWRDLSVQEHLYFFGRIRGIPKADLARYVDQALENVDLTFARKTKSSACSGGMRRRLSVAIALLGDPEVVLMDEMTTGLDPATTELVWAAIERAKVGKTVVVTTHSMEEAKVLCDRVHMLTRGKLRCSGNPEELRLRLGRGYRLTALVPEANVPGFHDLVMTNISSASQVETELGGSLNYSIPKDVEASTIFDTMAANKERLQIKDWAIQSSSLEDVFLNIVARDEAEVGVTNIAKENGDEQA